jgi:hypothetical protein
MSNHNTPAETKAEDNLREVRVSLGPRVIGSRHDRRYYNDSYDGWEKEQHQGVCCSLDDEVSIEPSLRLHTLPIIVGFFVACSHEDSEKVDFFSIQH